MKCAPFNTVAYVHPFRYPSAHAQQLRAIAFAKENKQRLLWTTAYDKPHPEAAAHLKGLRGEELKEEWLQLPVGRTSGIPGLFPLIKDLPIIFKECPDADARRKGVFKNARGILRGWELADDELQRLAATDEPEVVLKRRPKKVFIEMLNGSKDLPLVHGKRIYTLRCTPKQWSLDGAGNVPITRYGFCIVPDFAGTAHYYCGSSLKAAIGDLLHWWRTPTKEDALRAYIIRSRVRQNDDLLITQPYCPHLFRQKVLPGPDLLLKVLTHRIEPEDAREAWRRYEKEAEAKESKKQTQTDKRTTIALAKMTACCRRCSKNARQQPDDVNEATEIWKPLSAFECIGDSHTPAKTWQATFALGQDLLCWKCRPRTGWRTESLILCDECEKIRPEAAFSTDMQQAWKDGHDVRMCCRSCLDEGKTISEAPMHWCYGPACNAERREYHFLDETITAMHARQIDNVEQLCVRCTFLGCEVSAPYDSSRTYECTKCHAHKPLPEFSPTILKDWLHGYRNQYKWVCYECQYPLCKLCVESNDPLLRQRRPKDAIKHNALIDTVYYCHEHKYPRCNGILCGKLQYCDRKERPANTKGRFKSWSCGACKAAQSTIECISCKVWKPPEAFDPAIVTNTPDRW